jgi:hypothetical protein
MPCQNGRTHCNTLGTDTDGICCIFNVCADDGVGGGWGGGVRRVEQEGGADAEERVWACSSTVNILVPLCHSTSPTVHPCTSSLTQMITYNKPSRAHQSTAHPESAALGPKRRGSNHFPR